MELLKTSLATGKKSRDPCKADHTLSTIATITKTAKEETSGIQFVQTGMAPVIGTDGKLYNNITCLKCKQKRLYANSSSDKQELQFFQLLNAKEDNSI